MIQCLDQASGLRQPNKIGPGDVNHRGRKEAREVHRVQAAIYSRSCASSRERYKMSLKASFWAIEQRPRSRDHKLILMLLADWADETGEAWPRQTTIAMKAMCSVRHVGDLVRELETDGLLKILHTRRRDGRQGSNRYKLSIDL